VLFSRQCYKMTRPKKWILGENEDKGIILKYADGSFISKPKAPKLLGRIIKVRALIVCAFLVIFVSRWFGNKARDRRR